MLSARMTGALKRRATRALSSAAPAREASVLDGFFRKSAMAVAPLDAPFPGAMALTASNTNTQAGEVQVTTLENGLRVASSNSASPLSSLGVFVDSGSRHETGGTAGISNFLEHVAFKSTSNISDFRLVRDMLKVGANVTCYTSRQHTIYAADCMRNHMPYVTNALGDCLQNPLFLQDELDEAAEKYISENEERAEQMDVQIMEGIHAAAYANNTLGHSLYAPTHNLPHFTKEVLEEWTRTYFTADRIVVAGSGVDHAEFVAQVSQSFGGVPKSSGVETAKANYTGGDVRAHNPAAPDGLAHVALAFETASWHSQDLVPMCVLQMMMGGGGSFSAGGPGKGMYSRLYENVLNRHGWVESAISFNSIFEDTSLFGIYGTVAPEGASQLVDVLSAASVGMSGSVGDEELSRAKNGLKSAVQMQLETRALQLEDTGRQVLIYGRVKSAKEMCDEIDAVTAKDIQRVAAEMLKTTPSVAAYGDLSRMPRYDDIAKHFG
jgi:processing peptidase subunit alpha